MDHKIKPKEGNINSKEKTKQADEIIPGKTPVVDVARMVSESTATRAVIGYAPDGKPIALEMRGGVLVGIVGEEVITDDDQKSS